MRRPPQANQAGPRKRGVLDCAVMTPWLSFGMTIEAAPWRARKHWALDRLETPSRASSLPHLPNSSAARYSPNIGAGLWGPGWVILGFNQHTDLTESCCMADHACAPDS